jgi:hypothetical protein
MSKLFRCTVCPGSSLDKDFMRPLSCVSAGNLVYVMKVYRFHVQSFNEAKEPPQFIYIDVRHDVVWKQKIAIWKWKSFQGCVIEETSAVELRYNVALRLDTLSAEVMKAFGKCLGVPLIRCQSKLDIASAILDFLEVAEKDVILARIMSQATRSKKTEGGDGEEEEERPPYYDDEYDGGDSEEVAGEARKEDTAKKGEGSSDGAGAPSVGPPIELPRRPEYIGQAPPGCTMRVIKSKTGASPRWRGDLPMGATWLGQRSVSFSFDAATTANGDSDANHINIKGSRAMASERGAQDAVCSWLWAWHKHQQSTATAPVAAGGGASSKGSSSSSSSSSGSNALGSGSQKSSTSTSRGTGGQDDKSSSSGGVGSSSSAQPSKKRALPDDASASTSDKMSKGCK